MDDLRLGTALRAVRIRRGWRQVDVALRAHVSAGTISNLEHGRLGGASLDTLRNVAAVLDVRIDVAARWRGGELDRLLNGRHSRLASRVVGVLSRLGWLGAVLLPDLQWE